MLNSSSKAKTAFAPPREARGHDVLSHYPAQSDATHGRTAAAGLLTPLTGFITLTAILGVSAPAPAVELERSDQFRVESTTTVMPRSGVSLSDQANDASRRAASSVAATGDLTISGTRTAARASRGELTANAQFEDEIFSFDTIGPVTSTAVMFSSVTAIPDTGDLTLLGLFTALNPTGGSLETDIEVDFFLPPTLLEFTDNVERLVYGYDGAGNLAVTDAIGGPLTATVSALLIAERRSGFQDFAGTERCIISRACTPVFELEASLSGHYATDAGLALTDLSLSGVAVSDAARSDFFNDTIIVDDAATQGFERTLTVELPAFSGSILFRDLVTDYDLLGGVLEPSTERIEIFYELIAEVSGPGLGTSVVAAINDPLLLAPRGALGGDLTRFTHLRTDIVERDEVPSAILPAPPGLALLAFGWLALVPVTLWRREARRRELASAAR